MILGIDPGLANVGWAVVSEGNSLVAFGVIETKKESESAYRLAKIENELLKIFEKFEIDGVSVEGLFFAKNIRSALPVAEVIGVIKLTAEKRGVRCRVFTPLQVKMALSGYGRADKEQVERMVRSILGVSEPIKPSHAADAVAIALTYIMTNESLG